MFLSATLSAGNWGDTDEIIAKKIKSAVDGGLIPYFMRW